MAWWNPIMTTGTRLGSDNPFELFNSWEGFLNQYVIPETEIIRERGPGENIQMGEWYLTKDQHGGWFLSYVVNSSGYIYFVRLYRDTSPLYQPWKWDWSSGGKDGWGSKSKYHYKVDFDQAKMSWDFINWKDNPFISFK